MKRLPDVVPFPQENIHGHFARVEWFRGFLHHDDRIVELGCGTGYRITYPLLTWGYDAVGLDLDQPSLDYGRALLTRAGQPREALLNRRIEELPGQLDVVIASEVLEHVPDGELEALLGAVWQKLKPGGQLLVTVPNGYGWFELEVFIWWRLRLGLLLKYLGIPFLISRLKNLIVSGPGYDHIRATLANSPHVQRFTFGSIQTALREAGFTIEQARGSVAVAGPFSEMFLSGARRVEALNRRLGRRAGPLAAGFWIAARKPLEADRELPATETTAARREHQPAGA